MLQDKQKVLPILFKEINLIKKNIYNEKNNNL
jgi:hypothetical protein